MMFSQRIGKIPVRTVLQVESIDKDLKNRLWNIVLEKFFGYFSGHYSGRWESQRGEVCKSIWKEFYKLPNDEIPTDYSYHINLRVVDVEKVMKHVKEQSFNKEWYEIYELIQFMANFEAANRIEFVKSCNIALTEEVSGYRIVNRQVVQITSEGEVKEIEEAFVNTTKWKSINTHLETALKELSDKKSPNYRNSIKESISAVEALCRIITKNEKATLGDALTEIEKSHVLHSALKKGFASIYGYTSDSNGIRHSLTELDPKNLEFADAKFMLVSCSAFINYLKVKMKI